jgi:hypothetical protein
MLTPKKVKHRKWHKGRNRFSGIETRGTSLAFEVSVLNLKAEIGLPLVKLKPRDGQ